jgi:hypothetical protein
MSAYHYLFLGIVIFLLFAVLAGMAGIIFQ